MKKDIPSTLFAACILLTVISSWVLAQTDGPVTRRPPHQPLDQVRARRFVVRTLQGKPADLNKLIGQGRPVVIDFWATWCGPCRQEIPHLVEIAGRYRKDGLIVLGLTIEDPQADRDRVKSFAGRFKMSYPVAFAPDELFDFFRGSTGRRIIPQTYVFASDGRLIRRLIGYNEQKGREILTKAVEQALGPVGK